MTRWGLATSCLLLVACPDGNGKIIGEVPPELLGQAGDGEPGECYMPCTTAADCPAAPDGLLFGYTWVCSEGRCIDVDCVVDADCMNGDRAYMGFLCVNNLCTWPCVDDMECFNLFMGLDLCVDGACVRPSEITPDRCDVDADCIGVPTCTDLPMGLDCYCNHRKMCETKSVGMDPRCQSAMDCDRSQGMTTPTYVLRDAAHHSCVDGVCHWEGCLSHAECDAIVPGSTCDMATNFCRFPCSTPADCFALRPDEIQFGYWLQPQCNGGFCEMSDLCQSDDDCIATRGGRCFDTPNRANGFCGYEAFATCFSEDDCYEWETCRPYGCDIFFITGDPSDSGRSCTGDFECRAKHLAQSFWNRGGITFGVGVSDVAQYCNGCTTDADCGPDGTCIQKSSGSYHDFIWPTESVCAPTACTAAAGCPATYSSCDVDSECAPAEVCAWPSTACPGLCMNLSCAACVQWLDANTRHECFGSDPNIQFEIIRPD